jgi:hypothetical protein
MFIGFQMHASVLVRRHNYYRVTLGVVVLAQRVTMPTKFICKFPLHDQLPEHKIDIIFYCTCWSRDSRSTPTSQLAYAEVLARKEGPL